MAYLRRSPAVLVLLFGSGTIALLVILGLNFGPLHTDVEVFLVWSDSYGFWEFIDHYMEFNQRHILAAPRNAVVYWAFGDHMLPYHLVFLVSRMLEGVFLAGIVQQLTRRRTLAISAGLALFLTPIRLPALYQTISWGIESTLTMLMASTYVYLLSLQAENPRTRWKWYGLAFGLYALSVLSYESGIPWFGVSALAGWFMLRAVPWQQRMKRLVLEAVPFALTGIGVVVMVVFVFEPWNDLAPASTDALLVRIVDLLSDAVTFPALYLDHLKVALHDGYALWLLLGVIGVGGGVSWAIIRWLETDANTTDSAHADRAFLRDFWQLLLLGVAMFLSAIMLGASNPNMRFAYQDRITFGRSAGIALGYVTLIYGVVYLLHRAARIKRFGWQPAALLVTGLIFIGPCFAWLVIYQDEAQSAYDEIDQVAEAVLDVRCLFTRPLYMVIVTEPDWVGARFPDTVDLIIRQSQREIITAQGDVTIDILKAGNEGYEDDYLPPAGTCELNFPSGLCLEADGLRPSRWSIATEAPSEDIVVVRYANDGTITLLSEIAVADLDGYNIATSGPTVLKTSADRLAIPFEQMPVPLSGHCPGS